MTEARVREIAELPESTGGILKLLPVEMLNVELAALERALSKPWPNYSRVTLSELEFQPFTYTSYGRTSILCAVQHTTTRRSLCSDLTLWSGPRGDFWVLVAELAGLK